MTETIDSTAVDLDAERSAEQPAPSAAPSTDVVRRERRSEVIRPLAADDVVESFQLYQDLLPKLLKSSDYQSAGRDRDGNERKFVKKSGWRKIATAFDLDVQIIQSTVERDDQGQPARAEVWARAIAPSGRSMDGDGYCSVDEERFGKAGDADWKIAKARAKLENDLRATATTRAMNRAISGLVGMGEVSAEEVDASSPTNVHTLPAWAEPASEALTGNVRRALAYVTGGEDPQGEHVNAVLAKVGNDTGGLPIAAARALLHLAAEVRLIAEAAHQDGCDQ